MEEFFEKLSETLQRVGKSYDQLWERHERLVQDVAEIRNLVSKKPEEDSRDVSSVTRFAAIMSLEPSLIHEKMRDEFDEKQALEALGGEESGNAKEEEKAEEDLGREKACGGEESGANEEEEENNGGEEQEKMEEEEENNGEEQEKKEEEEENDGSKKEEEEEENDGGQGGVEEEDEKDSSSDGQVGDGSGEGDDSESDDDEDEYSDDKPKTSRRKEINHRKNKMCEALFNSRFLCLVDFTLTHFAYFPSATDDAVVVNITVATSWLRKKHNDIPAEKMMEFIIHRFQRLLHDTEKVFTKEAESKLSEYLEGTPFILEDGATYMVIPKSAFERLVQNGPSEMVKCVAGKQTSGRCFKGIKGMGSQAPQEYVKKFKELKLPDQIWRNMTLVKVKPPFPKMKRKRTEDTKGKKKKSPKKAKQSELSKCLDKIGRVL